MKARLAAAVLALGLGANPVALDQDYGHWTTVNGHHMYYEMRGAGRPLLLLHGGGSDIQQSFGRQLEPFAQAHRVIAPEQVGHGHTPDMPGPLSYSRMTEDTAALLKQLQLSEVDVVGYSDGGIVALILALRYPQLVRRLVVTGANLDPSGLIDGDVSEPAPAEVTYHDGGTGAATELAVDDKLMQLWLHYPNATELSPDLLKSLHKRVLVMAGDQDEIKLEHTKLIYESLPEARLWILPGTGHDTFASRWQWVNPVVLAFLDEP
jgi:pimeloyl-ACP methyl ester carboxylesterase